ncbi:MAG: nicotinate (nicotinamide) nucleotide adenylyltransferase [Bacteroidales bacterium]
MVHTGLLFGSFNPIHIGHVAIAGYMKEFAGMEEIWFIVSPQNPHKSKEQLATPAARLNMVRLALENYPSFKVSDIEFGMPVPSYTLDTMMKLNTLYADRDFHLIIGTDNIDSISHWKGSEILLKEYKFLIYPRLISGLEKRVSGNKKSCQDKLSKFNESENSRSDSAISPPNSKNYLQVLDDSGIFENAKFVDAPVIEISSSFIRNAIKESKDMQAFMPARAYDYLVKNRLYK